jgi:hypothetical protein
MKPGLVTPDQVHRRRRLGGGAAGPAPGLTVQPLAAAEDLGIWTQVGPMMKILKHPDHQVHGGLAPGSTGLWVPRRRRFGGSIEHVDTPGSGEQSGAGFF